MTETCPLRPEHQWRNMILFAGCTGLIYLAAPVLYVGITQASLFDQLKTSHRLANLPATAFFAMTVIPVLVAWYSPYVRRLKRNLACCFLAVGAVLLTVSVALMLELPRAVIIALVVLQGAVSGAAVPTAIALLWEIVGRGVEESRRGVALSLAFGAGPILAALSSLVQQALLDGKLGTISLPGMQYPRNFYSLFALGLPAMALAAWLSTRFVVPLPHTDLKREPFKSVVGLLAGICFQLISLGAFLSVQDQAGGGATVLAVIGYSAMALAVACFIQHFWDLLTIRVLLVATVVTILVYTGNTIPPNMNLYTQQVLDAEPQEWAGYQNALRFSFKAVAGFLLGWLLTKTHPKAGILVTASLFMAALGWAMTATGKWYLLAFGIYGAGELVGVYAPNYILSASRQAQIRRNMAFVTMLMAPAAPAAYLFGSISGYFGEMYGAAAGFRISFAACAVIVLAGIVIALIALPARPRPQEDQTAGLNQQATAGEPVTVED